MFNTVKGLTPGIRVSLLPSIQNSFNPLSCSSTSGCKGKSFLKKPHTENSAANPVVLSVPMNQVTEALEQTSDRDTQCKDIITLQ